MISVNSGVDKFFEFSKWKLSIGRNRTLWETMGIKWKYRRCLPKMYLSYDKQIETNISPYRKKAAMKIVFIKI